MRGLIFMEKYLKIDTVSLRLSWNDNELNNIISNLFTPWSSVCQTSDYHITVTKLDNHLYNFESNTGHSAKVIGKQELIGELENSITILSQKALNAYLQLHGACVEINNKGALIIGSHGIGKTTLALTSLNCGFKALTDDISLLDKNYMGIGFPRPFRLKVKNTDGLDYLPAECPTFDLYNGFTYVFFYLNDRRYYSEKTKIKYIFFPRRCDGPAVIRKIGETEALQNILKEGINFCKQDDGCVEDVIRLIRATSAYELSYSDNWDAVSKMKMIMTEI